MRGNLGRYVVWMFRDFVRDRGIALLLVGLLLGTTVVAPVRAVGRPIDAEFAKSLIVAVLSQVAFIMSFIALNGIVSNDRKMGYFRFLFSKPVSITAYYAQLFVVYVIGYLIVCAVLLGAFAIFAHPVSPIAPLLYCGLVFLSLGGIAFLVSSLFRYDWPILAAVFLGSVLLNAVWRDREGWRRLVLSVLPPLDRLSGALGEMMGKGAVKTDDVLWLLGYSAICFAAGLVVLRRRPFG